MRRFAWLVGMVLLSSSAQAEEMSDSESVREVRVGGMTVVIGGRPSGAQSIVQDVPPPSPHIRPVGIDAFEIDLVLVNQ